ncbi:MAG: C45 family peptidase [Nitriliruptoraceae bacterium]
MSAAAEFAPPPTFPFLRSAGSPFEVGRAHGAAFGDQINGSIALYREQFADLGFEWHQALEVAASAGASLSAFDRALGEELEGIAAGADVDPREILAINVRTGVIRSSEKQASKLFEAECTTSAVLPEVTADGHTLLAQNWDQRLACQPNTVIIEQHTAGEPAILFVTEAGILFRHGMNDRGIGVVGNALRSDRELAGDAGLPPPVARRRALRTDTLLDARQAIDMTPRSHSANHLVADAAGTAVDLEAVPGETFPVDPADGVLVHSNHFLNPVACETVADQGPSAHPDTLYRVSRLRQAIAAKSGSVSVADMQEALRDHHGLPKAVCRHAEDYSAPKAGITVSSSVMDLNDGRMWIAPGPPCLNDYTEYAFS